jgi:hypothetical protein
MEVVMRLGTKLHFIGDHVIKTERWSDRYFTAVDNDTFDPLYPVGEAADRYGAIVDLAEKMRERGLLS